MMITIEQKQEAINHIKIYGNLATWGNNFYTIIDTYDLLQKEFIIIYNEKEKVWKVVNEA